VEVSSCPCLVARDRYSHFSSPGFVTAFHSLSNYLCSICGFSRQVSAGLYATDSGGLASGLQKYAEHCFENLPLCDVYKTVLQFLGTSQLLRRICLSCFPASHGVFLELYYSLSAPRFTSEAPSRRFSPEAERSSHCRRPDAVEGRRGGQNGLLRLCIRMTRDTSNRSRLLASRQINLVICCRCRGPAHGRQPQAGSERGATWKVGIRETDPTA